MWFFTKTFVAWSTRGPLPVCLHVVVVKKHILLVAFCYSILDFPICAVVREKIGDLVHTSRIVNIYYEFIQIFSKLRKVTLRWLKCRIWYCSLPNKLLYQRKTSVWSHNQSFKDSKNQTANHHWKTINKLKRYISKRYTLKLFSVWSLVIKKRFHTLF